MGDGLLSRACCVCESPEKQTLFRQPLELPEGCSYNGYNIVACLRCGFLYADSSAPQPAWDRHYNSSTKVAQSLAQNSEPPEDIVRLDNSMTHIRRSLNPEASLLDIGCGTGYLLSRLRQDGLQKLSGIDQSPVAAGIARTKYGLDVTVGSIFDYHSTPVDFITVCHVLEHVADVAGFLRHIYGLLANGGTVYIEVPDASQFDCFVDPLSTNAWIYMKDLFTHFSPEHVNFFSVVSLRNLMTRFGFEAVFCESDPLGVVVSAWRRPSLEPDCKAREVLLRYAAKSRQLQNRAMEIIDSLADSGAEVVVWGAGLHTQRLLASGNLRSVNILAYVDSDPSYQGALLAGRPILRPEEIGLLNGKPAILISSWKAQRGIGKAIESMGIPNRVIYLYENR